MATEWLILKDYLKDEATAFQEDAILPYTR